MPPRRPSIPKMSDLHLVIGFILKLMIPAAVLFDRRKVPGKALGHQRRERIIRCLTIASAEGDISGYDRGRLQVGLDLWQYQRPVVCAAYEELVAILEVAQKKKK